MRYKILCLPAFAGMREIVICRDAIVGAATSRPQRNGTARLVEWHAIRTHCRGGSQPPAFVPGQKWSVDWYHVRHSTNSPKLIRDCRFIPRGRLRASPTVLSWCCGNSPNPVHHFWLVLRGRLVAAPTVAWMSFVPAKLQFREQYIILYLISYISYLKKGCPGRHPLVNQISMITGRIMGLRLVVL